MFRNWFNRAVKKDDNTEVPGHNTIEAEDEIIESDGLTIPHPELPARGFVLIPLQEIAPDLMHPVLKKTVREMVEAIDCTEISVYLNENESAGAP